MYTHYYHRKREINKNEFQNLLSFYKKLVKEIEKSFPSIKLNISSDEIDLSPIDNVGDKFSIPMCLSDEFEEDQYGMINLWCDTNKSPYDIVVVSILEAMKYYNITREYITDGKIVNIEEGKRLFLKLLEDNKELE